MYVFLLVVCYLAAIAFCSSLICVIVYVIHSILMYFSNTVLCPVEQKAQKAHLYKHSVFGTAMEVNENSDSGPIPEKHLRTCLTTDFTATHVLKVKYVLQRSS